MTIQYQYGDTNPALLTVATAQAVAVGDLVAYEGNTLIRAQDEAWATAVATPSAPTVADAGVTTTAGPLTNAATAVKISYQFPWGEGALSAAGSATPAAHSALLISGAPLAPPAPALWTNIYIETSAGSGTFKLWGTSTGESVVVFTYGNGPAPTGAAVLSDATTITQYNFAKTFAGVSAQRKDASTTTAYGNSKANQVRVDVEGTFRMDCASATYTAGQLVGPSKNSGANTLNSQTVGTVTHQLLAVGVVAEDTAASATQVKVKLLTVELPSQRQALAGGDLPASA